MPISREELFWLYRCILKREPESEQLIEWATETYDNFERARDILFDSLEFRLNYKPSTIYSPAPTDAECRRNPNIRLALATIVKNEEANIEFMLRSCLPVVDFIAIIDTGSTDNTVSLAKKLMISANIPHLVKSIPFIDFSQARNAALDAIPEGFEWTLMLDADEHLVSDDYQKLINLLEQDADIWALPRYNFNDAAKQLPVTPYPDFQKRLIRNRPNSPIRFTGAVHEQLIGEYLVKNAPLNSQYFGGSAGGPHIHHMGQVNLSQERFIKKHLFYTELANKKI